MRDGRIDLIDLSHECNTQSPLRTSPTRSHPLAPFRQHAFGIV